MGATIPVAMFAIRNREGASQRSFSFLYLANVLGAALGSCLPLVLIEPFGFSKTLMIGAGLNVAIALSALGGSMASGPFQLAAGASAAPVRGGEGGASLLALLFATGLATMAMELVWIRIFTPFIGPMVYSFGLILMAYLLATFVGSRLYRSWSVGQKQENRLAWISLTLLTVLPLLAADGRVSLPPALRVFLGVPLFAGMIGFLTPMLVGRCAGGDPDLSGRAYAVNVLGCILGPLLCGFVLLPWLGEHGTVGLLALPWLAMAVLGRGTSALRPFRLVSAYAVPLLALAVWMTTTDFENQ